MLTKHERSTLRRAAALIEQKAQELSNGCRCANSLEWDSKQSEAQHLELTKVASRLRGMADSKTSRL